MIKTKIRFRRKKKSFELKSFELGNWVVFFSLSLMASCTKVLQTKLWSTQIVIRVSEEPVCISRGPGHSVLVATKSGWIELHNVSGGERSHLTCRFRTTSSRVFYMGLLPLLVGEAIVTVEAQREGSDMQMLCVYTDWRSAASPSVTSIGLPSAVSSFAVCDAGRSRFAVSTSNFITLYQCLDGATLQPVLEISVSAATKLALFGDYLGWSVGSFVSVLQCAVEEDAAAAVSEAGCVDFVVSGGAGQASCLLLPSMAKDQKPFVALGPFRNLTVSVRADEGWRLVDCSTVLVQRADAPVHSLKMCAEPSIASVSSRNKKSEQLVRCLVSTADTACLFSLSRPTLLISRFTYASATFMAVLDNVFLYALQQQPRDRQGMSSSLVEVFSLRPSAAALPLRQLDEMSDWTLVSSHGSENSVELPQPCMMASLPFVGLQNVIPVKSGSVALMSKMISDDAAFWSVSVLFPERAVSIWRELAGKAALVKQSDPDTFLLFHLEGLLVLGSRLCQMTAEARPIDASMVYSTNDEVEETLFPPPGGGLDLPPTTAASEDDFDSTYSLFLESCRVLGDFFESKKLYEPAAVFWGFALVPIDEVTRRLLPERQAALALVEFVNRALKVSMVFFFIGRKA